MDYSKLIAQAAAEGPDMNESVAGGGGERVLPAAGMTRLRFVEYVELGDHMEGPKGQEKRKSLARFKFELSGPKHPAKEIDGRKIPFTISFTLPISRNEKSHYFKLFGRMNWQGKARIFPQLLGEDFLGTVVLVERGEGDKKRTYANLRDDTGFTIRSPFNEDPETGESKRISADPVLGSILCFMWDYVSKEAWDALFIDGKHDDGKDKDGNTIPGRSKNWMQDMIKAALNFDGSPICELISGGDALNLPEATKPERSEKALEESARAKVGANDDGDPLNDVA